MVAYIKTKLGIATLVSVIKVKVTVTYIEIQFLLNNFILLRPIETKFAVWKDYTKTQLGIATHVSVIKVKVTVTNIEIQFLLNNFSLLWPIDTKLAVWVAYTKTYTYLLSYW